LKIKHGELESMVDYMLDFCLCTHFNYAVPHMCSYKGPNDLDIGSEDIMPDFLKAMASHQVVVEENKDLERYLNPIQGGECQFVPEALMIDESVSRSNLDESPIINEGSLTGKQYLAVVGDTHFKEGFSTDDIYEEIANDPNHPYTVPVIDCTSRSRLSNAKKAIAVKAIRCIYLVGIGRVIRRILKIMFKKDVMVARLFDGWVAYEELPPIDFLIKYCPFLYLCDRGVKVTVDINMLFSAIAKLIDNGLLSVIQDSKNKSSLKYVLRAELAYEDLKHGNYFKGELLIPSREILDLNGDKGFHVNSVLIPENSELVEVDSVDEKGNHKYVGNKWDEWYNTFDSRFINGKNYVYGKGYVDVDMEIDPLVQVEINRDYLAKFKFKNSLPSESFKIVNVVKKGASSEIHLGVCRSSVVSETSQVDTDVEKRRSVSTYRLSY